MRVDVIYEKLDERGKALTSAAFAAWLAERRDRGVRDLCFVIGGAHGLDPSVLRRCDETMRSGIS